MDRMFINPILKRETLDRFYIRSQIFKFITKTLPLIKGNFLDVGCGKMPYKQYITENSTVETYTGLDIENAIEYDNVIQADIFWDGIKMPIDNESYHTIMATEVLEHCPHPNVTLNEIYRVLKVNGTFIFTVPFLWNLHETPHDEYRYTPFALKRLLTEAGFINIKLHPTGGWHASMAQMLGLWICRAPINNNLRFILKIMIFPIYKILLKKDRLPINFDEGNMITGIVGIAYKK